MRVLTSKTTKEITYKSHLSGSGTTILRSKFSFDLTDFLIRYHSGRREERQRAREREGGELEESAPDQFSEVSLAVFPPPFSSDPTPSSLGITAALSREEVSLVKPQGNHTCPEAERQFRSKFSFDFLIRYHSGRREERAREREGGELEESAPDQFSEVSLAVFFSVFFRPHTFLFRYHCAARRVKG